MKILIIRLSSLGDIVLTQPICAMLHDTYPEAEITMVCKPEYAELPQMFDPPVKVIPYTKSFAFHLRMLREQYNLIVDLHSKFASYLLAAIIPATCKLVYRKQRRLRKRIVKGRTDKVINSTVSLYVSALTPLDIKVNWKAPTLISPQPRTNMQGHHPEEPIIAIIPGATHYTKRYPTDYWIELINMHPEWQFRLFGSQADEDIIVSIMKSVGDNCLSYAGKLGLSELHQNLADCDLIISGDTGPMHLAATLQKPQLAIFGGTHPRLGFRPLNPKAVILSADISCQPCSLHGVSACHLGHFNCMRSITPQMLSDAAEQALLKQ